MGMFGTVGRAALNFAGRNLLGVDFERQKQQELERLQQQEWIKALVTGAQTPPPVAAPPVQNSEGADISGAFGPLAAQQGKPRSYQEMLPLLMYGAMRGYKGASEAGSLLRDAQPKAPVPLNTSQGVREYDPNSGGYRHLEDFPEKPEPAVSVDRVIGGILAKKASGQKLSPEETAIYLRWNNGTPPKPSAGGSSIPAPPSGWRKAP